MLFLVERERLPGVVGKVERIRLVADDEELHESQQRMLVAVLVIVLIVHDLLDGHTWRHPMRLQLHLHQWQAVDEDDHVVSVIAAMRVDAQLIDDLVIVLAPVL